MPDSTVKTLLATLLGVGAGTALIIFWIRYQEQHGLFYPTTYSSQELDRVANSLEYVEFKSGDGTKLTGLWKQGQGNVPAMVLAHGNAGNMLQRVGWFQRALPTGWSGLLFDYRGYGRSEGSPDEEGLYRDTVAAARFARFRNESQDLFLHGRSLGVPMVAYASQQVPVSGLVLESGFPDAARAARTLLGVPGIGSLLKSQYDTVGYLRRATQLRGDIPKLIIHGKLDRVLPLELGRTLFQLAPPPKQKWFVEGAGHNDLARVAGREYTRRLEEFLRGARPSNSRSEPRRGR